MLRCGATTRKGCALLQTLVCTPVAYKMTTKERIFAAWNGVAADHVPLTTWCFGLAVPPRLRWKNKGEEIKFWYSKRMEYLHTLPPQTWDLEDDFQRVLTWQSLGIDDILDVSVPWSMNSEVTWKDATLEATKDELSSVLVREYTTPAGTLRHAVRQTEEKQGDGWVIQPDYVPLVEDFNIPRAVEHAVSSPADIPKLRYLFGPPDDKAKRWFFERMQKVREFAEKNDVPVQAWSAFGMDAAVWFTGTEKAILMAMDEPKAFGELMEIIAEADLGRTELAASTPGVDMVVERGWYSSTDFWSPRLFDTYVYPYIVKLAEVAHKYGKKFAYVMTTGVEKTWASPCGRRGGCALFCRSRPGQYISGKSTRCPRSAHDACWRNECSFPCFRRSPED